RTAMAEFERVHAATSAVQPSVWRTRNIWFGGLAAACVLVVAVSVTWLMPPKDRQLSQESVPVAANITELGAAASSVPPGKWVPAEQRPPAPPEKQVPAGTPVPADEQQPAPMHHLDLPPHAYVRGGSAIPNAQLANAQTIPMQDASSSSAAAGPHAP